MTRAAIVRRLRVDAGTWNDLIESAWAHYKEHGRESIQSAFTEAMADSVLKKYQDKIAHGFARAGVEIDPTVTLTAESLARIVSDRTGLEIDTMTPESITKAVDKILSEQASELLRVPVESILNAGADGLKDILERAAMQAVEDGRAMEWITRATIYAARKYQTWKNQGIENPQQVMNREYQRRYRKTHKLVWE